jgi:hypothetical protein
MGARAERDGLIGSGEAHALGSRVEDEQRSALGELAHCSEDLKVGMMNEIEKLVDGARLVEAPNDLAGDR